VYYLAYSFFIVNIIEELLPYDLSILILWYDSRNQDEGKLGYTSHALLISYSVTIVTYSVMVNYDISELNK
jgi:hypothetical protein